MDFKETPIGFLVWQNDLIYAEIDIFKIKPKYRNKGLGKVFLELFSDFLKENGFLVMKLFCSPIESEKFWKKMGFIKFPARSYSESDLTYFKPLIKFLPISINELSGNKIELWDVEPYQKNEHKPKWT